ncbi:hypothetical protein BJV78DRAFT_1368771 [Lactifluus subvellereus]|nr:hypothetical protein BJV78DRAFT_1368771 [Lactifluus subvellereus]
MPVPTETRPRDFRVAIVGGGVCGIVLAIGLCRAGVKVDIFEAAVRVLRTSLSLVADFSSRSMEKSAQASESVPAYCTPSFQTFILMISLGPNAVRILGYLGVLDKVAAHTSRKGPDLHSFRFHAGWGDHELVYTVRLQKVWSDPMNILRTVCQYPARPEDLRLGLHRAALLDALVTYLASDLVTTNFNKRCVKIVSSSWTTGRVVLHFTDGTTHEADIVAGADGVRSNIREFVASEEASVKSPAYSNCAAYRGLTTIEALETAGIKTSLGRWPICWMGNGQNIVTFPLAKGVINIVAFVTDFDHPMGSHHSPDSDKWVKQVTQEEVLETFSEFGEDPQRILRCIEEPSKWSIHVVYPNLNSFVKGNVVLLGDSVRSETRTTSDRDISPDLPCQAHAMLPFLGAGAGQGIEDAYVLASLLGHPQTKARNLEVRPVSAGSEVCTCTNVILLLFFFFFAKAILQAYDRVRVPRANFVAARSKLAGDIYQGHGPSGSSPDARRADLELIWDPVWHHDINADIENCVRWLVKEGVFV